MSTRTTWVPLHTILVVRSVNPDEPDGPTHQVDAFAEYQRTGKAFKFTDAEVKEIIAGYDGNPAMALRSPTEESVEADDGTTIRTSLASNEVTKKTTADAKKADGKKSDEL